MVRREWAKASDLIRCGLMTRLRGLPMPANALPIAKAFRGRDVFLPTSQWLRHFVIFGPTGSGKSKTFFMSMIRAILQRSSCLVYDPKGELYAQTAGTAERVYRLGSERSHKKRPLEFHSEMQKRSGLCVSDGRDDDRYRKPAAARTLIHSGETPNRSR